MCFVQVLMGLRQLKKKMFLDIACCFQGAPELFILTFFDSCGFHPHIGMRILFEKSLIYYVDGRVWMHDLLQDLGRKIVMEKSFNEPGKWSRLWSCEHLHHIMSMNSATEDIEVIYLPESYSKEMTLKAQILSKMSHLRHLRIINGMKISGNLIGLSNEIRCLVWRNYPDAYLPHPFSRSPSIFQLDRLFELFLTCCRFKVLWESIKPLDNLKILNLNNSKNLIKTPDFRGMPNLKRLFLEECTSLKHVDESIGVLSKLEGLYLRNCTSLIGLPNSIFCLTSLQILDLALCSKLENPFEKTTDAVCLKDFIEKPTFTFSIVQKAVTSPLQFFTRRHKEPSELLVLHGLLSLKSLYLGFCNLRELPDAIEQMQSLEVLELTGNDFVTLPSTIKNLSRLVYLNLGECKELQYLPELPLSTSRDVGEKFAPIYDSSRIRFGGLCIYNCPKLVQDETEPYTKLAVSWLTKLIQEPHHTESKFDIVIPGNDVPKWFNHQSMGRSTRVQMPHSNEWIGVALCVVLVPTGYGIQSDISFSVQLCGTHKKIQTLPLKYLHPILPVSIESDYLCLLYLPREKSTCKTLQTWGARKELEFIASGKDIKVAKFGIRWVSEQDIMELQICNY